MNAFEPEDFDDEALYDEATIDSIWWHEVEPLVDQFHQACTQYYKPSDSVAVNESMICCFGHSLYTYKMPNKPISQGYKLYVQADYGYVWYWIWASCAKSMVEVVKGEGLTKTGIMVYQFLQKMPQEASHYNVYLNN